jgi:pentose-5-phosphate-3-epimerase
VNDPALHVADVVRCGADVVFVQVDNVNDPVGNLRLYLEAGLTAGANVSNLDLGRPYLDELLALSPYVLVGTTAHDDKAQTCRPDMLEFAKRVAADGIHEVWVDGGITAEIFYGLADSAIHAAVLGRAIFADKDCAINLFCR